MYVMYLFTYIGVQRDLHISWCSCLLTIILWCHK